METSFSTFLKRKVKVCFLDDGRTKVVYGILTEVNTNYIIVDTIVIGLGSNFISCKLEETND